MLPNFGALELKLEKSLTLMEKIVVELREIKNILKEQNGKDTITTCLTFQSGDEKS